MNEATAATAAMTGSGDPAELLAVLVAAAVQVAGGPVITPAEALVRQSAPEHGCDYQSNVAMALAKRIGEPPRELAQRIASALDAEAICEPPEVAGPGFINLRLRGEWLAEQLSARATDARLGVPMGLRGARIVIDYSAPNVAKEMHVGHLRSTIIGDSLMRLAAFAGAETTAQNHIGDWGTPFGMLIEHMLERDRDDGDALAPGERPAAALAELNDFYKAAHARWREDEQFAERARARVVALQGGDEQTRQLWRELVRRSELHFEAAYRLLGVLLGPRDIVGESAYQEALASVADELEQAGLARLSDGALCVFPKGFNGRDGEPLPMIVRKRDGGYSYDATDLAALRHRVRELAADEVIYVVGAPQRLHFEMLFAVAGEAGWLEHSRARHVPFGSVLGEDRKMLRTRSGEPVRLIELLREAVERAAAVLAERGAEPDEELARAIGIGAVKYADLSVDREHDYVFSYERMLSLEGNTAVYLQYANARAESVLRRGGDRGILPDERIGGLQEGAERDLALAILRFPAALAAALEECKPHRLCGYLHGLAVAYSAFYEQCPILTADRPQAGSRLLLCRLVATTLSLGLSLLGIEAPQRLSPPPPATISA